MAIKVCHLTSMHNPFDGRIFKKQCMSLSKKYDVSLIQNDCEDQTVDGIKVYGVQMPAGRLKRMTTVKPVLNKALEIDADIYQIHDPELLRIIPILKKKGKKVIFDSHENFPGVIMIKEYLPLFLRRFISHFYERYEKSKLRYCDALISVTPDIVNRLSKIGPRSFLVTNYPIYNEMVDNRKWGRSVCFAGGLTKEWMHHSIIESLSLTNAKYRIAGFSAYKHYEDALKAMPGWNQVEFLGKIKALEVAGFMQESSAGMALYTYDDANVNYKEGTLGNQKIFEYMMAGIPLITSHLRLWEQLVKENDCGMVVEPEDVKTIADAINYLTNNPEEAKRMGDNAHQAVRDKYNWSTQEKTLFEAYEYVEKL